MFMSNSDPFFERFQHHLPGIFSVGQNLLHRKFLLLLMIFLFFWTKRFFFLGGGDVQQGLGFGVRTLALSILFGLEL